MQVQDSPKQSVYMISATNFHIFNTWYFSFYLEFCFHFVITWYIVQIIIIIINTILISVSIALIIGHSNVVIEFHSY